MRIVLWECQGRGCEDVESAVDACVNDASPPKWGGLKLRAELNQIYHLLGMDPESSVLNVEAFTDDLWTLLGRTDGSTPDRPLWVTIHDRAEEARALAKLRTTFSVREPAGLGHTFASVAKTMQAFGDALAGSGLPDVCSACGQDPEAEVYGEYHCAVCGVPTLHDDPVRGESADPVVTVSVDEQEVSACDGCFLCGQMFDPTGSAVEAKAPTEADTEPADTEAPGFVPDGGLVGDGWEESTPIEVGQVWIAKDPDALGQRWTKVVVKEGPNEGGLYGVVPHDEPEYLPSFVTAESLRASMRRQVPFIAPEAPPDGGPYLGGPDPFTAAGVQPVGSAGGPVELPAVPWVDVVLSSQDVEMRELVKEAGGLPPALEPTGPYAEHLTIVEARKAPTVADPATVAGATKGPVGRVYWPPNLSRWAAQTWWEAPYTGWVGTVDYGDKGWRWFIQPPPSANKQPYYTEFWDLDSPDQWPAGPGSLRWSRIADTGPITSPGEVQAPAVLSVDPSAVPAVPVSDGATDIATDTATDTDQTDPGGW